MQYASLSINTLIMHQLLAGRAKPEDQQLSDVPTPTAESDRVFIQERLRGTLAKSPRPIIQDPGPSPVPGLIQKYLHDGADAIGLSRVLANRLQQSHHHVSPAGIFVLAEATFDGARALIIAKLEHNQGVRATPTKLEGGEVTFGVELLKDLLFTTGSKVFKAALFRAEEVTSAGMLVGVLVDSQMTGHALAQFFMTEFLGCKLAERSETLTANFYTGSQSFINSLPDPEKRARYEIALMSEMQSQERELSSAAFAARHLELEDRDAFTSSLTGSGVPNRRFEKDTGLIKNRVKKVEIVTEKGVTVLAPPETMSDGVVSIEGNDNHTTITVTDRITTFR